MQEVDGAVSVERCVGQAAVGIEVGDVGPDACDLELVRPAGAHHRVEPLGVHIREQNPHAVVGAEASHRQADAAPAAGDDRHATFQVIHPASPFGERKEQ